MKVSWIYGTIIPCFHDLATTGVKNNSVVTIGVKNNAVFTMASGICLASGGGRCCYQPPSSCCRPPLNPSPPERWLPNFHPWLRQGRAGPVTGDWPGSDLSPSSKSLSRFNLLVYLCLF
ncbi:hypothetical protein HanPI659440_Chr11g0440961 [Helianthus annuus]|nr:hypothetical protein HanPI659440_Chr11g0440961 [Helianthus annuus]